ncbi:hypothetical protein [Actinoplanes sp. NPDC026623]|uniref:hypothetical protein n=1 Tax=Actinoplanes sp. NPDC026623 TaxID=3155610 RepID=UPI0033EFF7F6
MDAVDPKLRSFYSHSYAGLDVKGDRLIIYRKPDAALDAFVRGQIDDVDVEFRDAPYSLDELEQLTERVRADWHYWATRRFPLRMVIPRLDGTGVNASSPPTTPMRHGQSSGSVTATSRSSWTAPARTGIVPAR